jgi:DNA-binding transcriptional MerR regulator
MKHDLISIGQFSILCKISVKALRYYDEQGLLKPAHTDSRSSYRYYSSAQLPEANLIRLLRSLEVGLEDVRSFLKNPDKSQRRSLLESQRQKLEKAAANYR